MSRIGKQPVPVLDGVKASVADRTVTVEGPQGKLTWQHRPEVTVALEDGGKEIVVSRRDDSRQARALHGLTRSIVNNMVVGVKDGYEKRLEIQGVGYEATLKGDAVELRVGFANDIQKKIPKGVEVTLPDRTHIIIKGCDKQKVGQFAAEVRAVRKPEPYKGKGIRYQGEYVKIKPGKTAT